MNTSESPVAKLSNLYDIVENTIHIDVREDLGILVTANGGMQYPVQRWFAFKEAYSLGILETVLNLCNTELESVKHILDCFAGTGTTILAAQRLAHSKAKLNIKVTGFERNPFLHFVSSTKCKWDSFDVISFRKLAKALLKTNYKPKTSAPILSTLHNNLIFEPELLNRLHALQEAIQIIDTPEKNLLLLGFASILEAVSGARKDGRALRIESNKRRPTLHDALTAAWEKQAQDLEITANHYAQLPTQIFLGDGRLLVSDCNEADVNKVDLVLFSPPYLNNIDYTEVYKVEAWMCGFINNTQAFQDLRRRTLRSHPSIRFNQPTIIDKDAKMVLSNRLINQLLEAVPKDKYYHSRREIFLGYFDDLYRTLQTQHRVLNVGGWSACVVGNSLHGSRGGEDEKIPIASDLIIAVIAQELGFRVKSIVVARYPKRRSPKLHHLRESIVLMEKVHLQ